MAGEALGGAASQEPIPGLLITGELPVPELLEQWLGERGLAQATVIGIPDVRRSGLEAGQDEEPEPIDLSTMTPDEFISERYRLEDLVEVELREAGAQDDEQRLAVMRGSRNHQRLFHLESGIRPFAETHPDLARIYFHTLRLHPDGSVRGLAQELIFPLLTHEVATDNPRPEDIIAGWVEMARDDEDNNGYEAHLLIGELFRTDEGLAIIQRLTAYQLRQLLWEEIERAENN